MNLKKRFAEIGKMGCNGLDQSNRIEYMLESIAEFLHHQDQGKNASPAGELNEGETITYHCAGSTEEYCCGEKFIITTKDHSKIDCCPKCGDFLTPNPDERT